MSIKHLSLNEWQNSFEILYTNSKILISYKHYNTHIEKGQPNCNLKTTQSWHNIFNNEMFNYFFFYNLSNFCDFRKCYWQSLSQLIIWLKTKAKKKKQKNSSLIDSLIMTHLFLHSLTHIQTHTFIHTSVESGI